MESASPESEKYSKDQYFQEKPKTVGFKQHFEIYRVTGSPELLVEPRLPRSQQLFLLLPLHLQLQEIHL